MATADQIVDACADAFDVPRDELMSPSRIRRLSRARQATYWMLRTFPTPGGVERSFPQIGRIMGRDHGSVIQGYRTAEYLLERDARFTAMIADAAELMSGAVMLEPLSPKDIPERPRERVKPSQFRHVKARNEVARDDTDARMRLHGTFALGRALQAAMAKRGGA